MTLDPLRGGIPALLAAGFLLCPASVRAADLPVQVDAVVVPLAEGSLQTHVYLEAGPIEVPPGYRPEKGGGDLLVEFHLRRDGDEEGVESWQRVYAWSDSAEAGVLVWREELIRTLAPGRYDGKLEVKDLAGDRTGGAEFRLEVPEAGTGWQVSGILLGTCPGEGDPAGEFLPHPSHEFHTDREVVCALLRFAGNEEELRVHYELRESGGRSPAKGTETVPPSGAELVLRPHLDALLPGRYRLRVDGEGGGRAVRREIDLELTGGGGGIPSDPLEIRTILSYVATGPELAELDRTENAGLRAFWERFWARRDRVPETETNEAETEFLRRVDYAVRYLGDMHPGWDTDRGEMYIRYGEPDRMETIPGGGGRLPTWIWYYYDRNLTLVFQDLDGSGTYRLAANRRR